jgi:hypothetical protein
VRGINDVGIERNERILEEEDRQALPALEDVVDELSELPALAPLSRRTARRGRSPARTAALARE